MREVIEKSGDALAVVEGVGEVADLGKRQPAYLGGLVRLAVLLCGTRSRRPFMLRQAQHERGLRTGRSSKPFALSLSKGE